MKSRIVVRPRFVPCDVDGLPQFVVNLDKLSKTLTMLAGNFDVEFEVTDASIPDIFDEDSGSV